MSSSTSLLAARQLSTPTKQTAPIPESPGNWKHPRLAEITKRQKASSITEVNVKTVVYNVVALGALVVFRLLGAKATWIVASLAGEQFTKQYGGWVWTLLQLIPLLNIAIALLPLWRKKDDMEDIPLTAAQRKLLGLPPSSAPATPGSVYSTPPRYSRTPSMSGSVGSNKSYASSPTSALASQTSLGLGNGSPYSPSTPLLQKAFNGARRSSFGSPSPMGTSTGASLFGGDLPSTPSPSAGKRSSVGLNSKWLYEKGRRK